MTALLEARDVTKIFGSGVSHRADTVALRHFTFGIDAERPSITGVVGESGSGKSTMARLLLGLETPTEGSVLYQGQDLRRLRGADHRQYRQNIQAIFQDPFESFNSLYKVDHVLEVPLKKFGLARTNQEVRRLMVAALQTVGLRPEETLGRYPHQLSGGQRQRIMVARALMLSPKLIIADEPVSMIDASLRAGVLANLRQLRDEFGISLVYITHDLTTAYQICDSIIVLYRGYVAEAFFRSGLTKIRDWDTTLALFSDEYKVPLLSPGVAAVMGTGGELVLPVLLLFGLGGRFAALGLSVMNVVAVISLSEIAPAALQQHVTWGVLLAALAIFGVGRWSLDGTLLKPWLRRWGLSTPNG